MNIVKKLIQYNFTPNANTAEYIVIHDTGNKQSGANALMHYKYFNSGDKSASAHFFCDDTQILQLIEVKDKAWHCGDGGNKYGIGNKNSIGIEICINSDGNYNQTIQNTIELIVELMKTYNIPIDKVIRHYDASRKNCPQTMNDNGDWTKWLNFKQKVQEMINDMTNVTPIVEVDQEFKDNLDYLVSYGKINSPSYWLTNCVPNGKVDGMYAKAILTKFAELLKNNTY